VIPAIAPVVATSGDHETVRGDFLLTRMPTLLKLIVPI